MNLAGARQSAAHMDRPLATLGLPVLLVDGVSSVVLCRKCNLDTVFLHSTSGFWLLRLWAHSPAHLQGIHSEQLHVRCLNRCSNINRTEGCCRNANDDICSSALSLAAVLTAVCKAKQLITLATNCCRYICCHTHC